MSASAGLIMIPVNSDVETVEWTFGKQTLFYSKKQIASGYPHNSIILHTQRSQSFLPFQQ